MLPEAFKLEKKGTHLLFNIHHPKLATTFDRIMVLAMLCKMCERTMPPKGLQYPLFIPIPMRDWHNDDLEWEEWLSVEVVWAGWTTKTVKEIWEETLAHITQAIEIELVRKVEELLCS